MAKLIQKLNPLQVLNRLMDTIQSTDNIIEIFAEADQLIRQMIRCDQIYFLLNNDQARHFYVNQALNFADRESAEDIIIPYNSTGLTEMLQSGRSLRRHDLSGRGKLTPGDLMLLPPGTQSDLSVPIINKHEVLAIMNLSSHQAHFFTKAQQLFAEQVGLLLGFAMARSRLLEKLAATQSEATEWKNKLTCVTRHMQEAMVVIRPDYDLIYEANPAFERLSGYTAQELQTMRLATLHPQYAEQVRPQLHLDAMNGQQTHWIQVTLLRKNGDAILVSLHLVRDSAPGQRLVYLFYREGTHPAAAASEEKRQPAVAPAASPPASNDRKEETGPPQETRLWKEIDAVLTSPASLIDKIRSVLVAARQMLPFDYGQFDLFDPSGEHIRRFAMISERCRPLDSQQSWQQLPEPDLFWSGIEEKPLAQVIHEPARAIEKEIRSSIPLPLLVYDQYSGMLVLGRLEAGGYLQADIQLAEQIAQKITRLIEIEQGKPNLLSPTHIDSPLDNLSQIGGSLSLDQVLENIVQAAAGALHANLATIRLMEEGNPSPAAIFSRPDIEQNLITQFEKHMVLPRLLVTEEPLITAPIGNGNVSREAAALLDATPLRSHLSIPITSDQRVPLAILSIYWDRLHPLPAAENRWLEMLLKLSARAIQNAQLHETLQRDYAYARHRQLSLEEFAKMATEALNAALTNIQGIHAALRQEFLPDINQEVYHCLQQIQCHAARARCVVQAWHEFFSLIQTPMSVEEINVAEIIKQAIHELRPKIVKRNIEIIIEEVLPLVYADRQRLRQVFLHLIDLAIGQLGDRGDQPKIEIGHRAVDAADQFFIRNNGPAARHLPRQGHFQLFDCLCQDDEPPTNGTLVDLLIVQQIVEQHRGEMWFDSEPDSGNALYFTLPRD